MNPWGERLGGAENILWTLLRHVDRSRIEPVVVFLAEGPFVDEVEAQGIRTEILPTRRLRYGGRFGLGASALARLLRRERPDVVLGWGPKPQLYVAPVAAALGRRSSWMLLERPSHIVHRTAVRLPSAAILCVSEFVAADVRALAPKKRTLVVHPGIELPEPVPPGVAAEVREQLGIAPDDVLVGMVARLAPVKNQDRLLEAVAELRRRGLTVHAVLVGGDAHALAPEYGPYLRSLVSDFELEDAVTFAGQAADPRPYLAAMDVFVSAARDEGFGISLLEAMALETPVVGVDAGGPREIVEHGRSGLLVPAPDPEPLADAVERLAGDRELRATIGAGGRRRVEAEFTAERMAAAYAEALEDLAGSGPVVRRQKVEPATEEGFVPDTARETHAELPRIARNALSAYGMRAVMALSVLAVTPYLYRTLGAGGFGTWSVVFTIGTIFTLIETGFSRGVSKVVAQQLAEGDRERLAQTIGTSIGLLSLLGIVAAVISVLLGWFGSGIATGSTAHAFQIGMLVLGLERLLYFPIAAYGAALVGYQRYDYYNLANVVNTLAFTIGAFAVVEAGYGVLAVIVAFAVAHFLMGVACLVFLRRTDRELSLKVRLGDRATRRWLTSFSSYVLLAESMTFIGQRMDTLVIAALRNAAAAGPYSAVLKLQTGLQSLTLPVVYQLMPMASDLWARRRGVEVHRRLILATRVVLQVTLPVAAAFALFASDTIDLWLGKGSPEVADVILVVLMVVQVPALTTAPAEQVLVGIGRVRAVGLLTLAEGTSNLAVSLVLVYAYGPIGAALGTLFTSALISPIKVPLVCRALGVSTAEFLRKSVAVALASSVPALVSMVVVRLTMGEGLVRLAAGVAAGGLLTAAVGVAQIGPHRVSTALRQLGSQGPAGLASAGSSRL